MDSKNHIMNIREYVLQNGLLFAAEWVTFCRTIGYFLPQKQAKWVTFCRTIGYFLPQALFVKCSLLERYGVFLLLINNLINNSNKLFNELFNKDRALTPKTFGCFWESPLLKYVQAVTNNFRRFKRQLKSRSYRFSLR